MAIKNILKSILNVKCIKIISITFDELCSTLSINVNITKGKQKRCPVCGKKCSGYDKTTESRKWRALDFGSCKVFIVANVNRIHCKEHGVITENVPWAEHHSNFTKDFEQQVAYLALHLNKTDVSKMMRISWNTVGPILSRTRQRLEPDTKARYIGMSRIGIDETSYRKGHKYITVVTDHDTKQVVWVGVGTGIKVLEKFMKDMTKEQRQAIKLVSADGAKWIKSCVESYLPNAELCIDGFHVVSWAIEAMDECRKHFWRGARKLKKDLPKRHRGRPHKDEIVVKETATGQLKFSKYALGKNPENLTGNQESCLDDIRKVYPKLFRAYQLKEGLREVFRCDGKEVENELKHWLAWACRSRIPEFVELSKKIRRHYDGIVATVKHNISNARIESMNNKIKVIIRKAYGFRNMNNLIDMVMIACSNLYHQIKLAHQLR